MLYTSEKMKLVSKSSPDVVVLAVEAGGCLPLRPIGKGAVFCHNKAHRPYYVIQTAIYSGRTEDEEETTTSSTMAPWDNFDAIFSFNPNFVYDGKVLEQIVSNRRALENQLFADRLLGLIGVNAGKN